MSTNSPARHTRRHARPVQDAEIALGATPLLVGTAAAYLYAVSRVPIENKTTILVVGLVLATVAAICGTYAASPTVRTKVFKAEPRTTPRTFTEVVGLGLTFGGVAVGAIALLGGAFNTPGSEAVLGAALMAAAAGSIVML